MIKILLPIMLFFAGCEKIDLVKESKTGEPVEFIKGKTKCIQCGMKVRSQLHSTQAILPSGKVYFFDDLGCMAKWYLKHKDTKAKLWVYTNDTKRYIEAKRSWYRLGESTPMNYRFGAYEKRVPGSVGFEKFIMMMVHGENLTNPALRKKYLGV